MPEKGDTTEELAKVVLAALTSHRKGKGKSFSKDKASKGKGQNRKHLDPKELKRRRDNNLCLECGSSDHMIADCPRLGNGSGR